MSRDAADRQAGQLLLNLCPMLRAYGDIVPEAGPAREPVDGDKAGTPNFGMIQPALGFDFEILSARNIRECDSFRAYCERGDRGDFRDGIAIFGATELSMANALDRVRSRRPGKSTAADSGPRHRLRRILAKIARKNENPLPISQRSKQPR